MSDLESFYKSGLDIHVGIVNSKEVIVYIFRFAKPLYALKPILLECVVP